MPCNSDYLNPTHRERSLQETAQLLCYVYRATGSKPPRELDRASGDIYCRDDYVPTLCRELRELDEATRDTLMSHKTDPFNGPRLALWWHEHKAADAAREEQA